MYILRGSECSSPVENFSHEATNWVGCVDKFEMGSPLRLNKISIYFLTELYFKAVLQTSNTILYKKKRVTIEFIYTVESIFQRSRVE